MLIIMGLFGWLIGESGQHNGTSPLDSHDGWLAENFSGKSNGTNYIEGNPSKHDKFTTLVSEWINAKNGRVIGACEVLEVGEHAEGIIGYGDRATYDDYVAAQDPWTGSYDCGTGQGG